MKTDFNSLLQGSLGRLENLVVDDGSVGTSAVKLSDAPNVKADYSRSVRVLNTHDSQKLALKVVDVGASAPTVSTSGANAGVVIMPGESLSFIVSANKSIYLAGEGASTTYNVSFGEDNG